MPTTAAAQAAANAVAVSHWEGSFSWWALLIGVGLGLVAFVLGYFLACAEEEYLNKSGR